MASSPPPSSPPLSSPVPESPTPNHLTLISYGRAHGPLPATCRQLIFSVRDLPNPPVALRKTHTGLSKRLRTEVLGSSAAQQRLGEIVEAVEAKMREVSAKGCVALGFVVGICCEEGRHRSVSFVEELGRRVKVQGWDVDVRHRDLENEKGRVKRKGEREGRKKGKWTGGLDGDESK